MKIYSSIHSSAAETQTDETWPTIATGVAAERDRRRFNA
jgi:hypothetical protein